MCTESIKETCTLCFYDMKDLWKKIKEKVRNIRKPKTLLQKLLLICNHNN